MRRLVVRGETSESLTTKEAELLSYLAEHPDTDVSRDELLREVWGFAGRIPNTRAPDFAMRRLRAKVEADPSRPAHLLTVHGQGYRFAPPVRPSAPAATAGLQAPGAAYDASWYATRGEEEREAATRLRQAGAPVVLVAPRSAGKTWLLRRLLDQHVREADRVVQLDVGTIDPDGTEDPDEALLQLAIEAAWAVGIDEDDVSEAWARMGHARRRLTRFVERDVLPRVSGRLFLAIDGADQWQRHGDPSGFFGLLRSWCSRARAPWDRLRLLLTVSTDPAALPVEPHVSPFNLAPPIRVRDLDASAVRWLAERAGGRWSGADLDELRSWVGGHPLLVRTALYAPGSPREVLDAAGTEASVFAPHLRRITRAVRARPELYAGLQHVVDGDDAISADVLYALEGAGWIACRERRWHVPVRVYEVWLRNHR